MGQYYHPIILSKSGSIKGFWNAHKTGNGLKLMEHSYINNTLCNCVENYLIKNNGARVVWAGDYADPEKVRLSKAEANEVWKNKVASGEITCSFGAFWASKSPDLYKPESDDDENLYSLCEEKTIELPNGKEKVVRRAKKELEYDTANNDGRFLVNDDRKEFIDLWNVVCAGGMRVNPLPLLTCEGNQRGGGDYYGLDESLIGTWVRNFIRLLSSDWSHRERLVTQGYTELKPTFAEGYEIKSDLKQTACLLSKALDIDRYRSDANYIAEIRMAIDELKKMLPRQTQSEKKIRVQLEERKAKYSA